MAFLDCYIWEINKFPRYGKTLNRNTIANVFHVKSDENGFQNNNVNLQVPDFLIQGTADEKNFVYKYKDRIVKYSLPIIVSVINSYGELEWKLDVGVAEHLKYLRN
jgi:hypothetical protein